MLENTCWVTILRVFKCFLALWRIKQLKLGLFCAKLSTQHYLVYIIALKWLEVKIIIICQKLRVKLQLGLFCTKIGTQHYLVYIIVLKWLEQKIILICQKLLVKLRFYAFLCFFGTFTHKVAQSLFVLHETWHTTPFGIYYFVKVVIFENHSHILEIAC